MVPHSDLPEAGEAPLFDIGSNQVGKWRRLHAFAEGNVFGWNNDYDKVQWLSTATPRITGHYNFVPTLRLIGWILYQSSTLGLTESKAEIYLYMKIFQPWPNPLADEGSSLGTTGSRIWAKGKTAYRYSTEKDFLSQNMNHWLIWDWAEPVYLVKSIEIWILVDLIIKANARYSLARCDMNFYSLNRGVQLNKIIATKYA